jgi:uncharacterized membrane protein YhfC
LGTRWKLFGAGAVTFLASQVVHLPLVYGLTLLFRSGLLPAPPAEWSVVFNAILLGAMAGLCEEGARYLAYRWLVPSACSWRDALMVGAGHGGIEAMILGVLAGLAFVQLVALRNADLTTLPLPPDQLPALQQQVAAYWSAPWYGSLLGAWERAAALALHLSLAVLVMQAITRGNFLWLAAAILWHAGVNAVAVVSVKAWGPYGAEAVVGLCALVSVGLIVALRSGGAGPAVHPQPVAGAGPVPAAPPSPPAASAPRVDEGAVFRERIGETRYLPE